jgi:hypothetical protein
MVPSFELIILFLALVGFPEIFKGKAVSSLLNLYVNVNADNLAGFFLFSAQILRSYILQRLSSW